MDIRTKIFYENKNLLVCYKPAGLATESASFMQADMVSELRNYISGQNAKRNPYLGLIHRLDQPVEGLVVLAKTRQAAADLSKQLMDGRLHKKYLAILCGVPTKRETVLVNYLKRIKQSNNSVVTSKEDGQAKRAELSYRILAEREGQALAEIELMTGRHHQIRVQMAHIGCPLYGDMKYGKAEGQNRGLALCAYFLEFSDPFSGERRSFKVLPEHPAFEPFYEILRV